MQLYAINSQGELTSSFHGMKQKDYLCPECQGVVRLRSGIHRRAHFYHIESVPSCHLGGKSLIHLKVQLYLQSLIGPELILLEKKFNEINRIADCTWPAKKIIFEIQCSYITVDEVKKRMCDYHSIGYEVIWILHDRRFNRSRLTAFEAYLRDWPHYYTNMTAEGAGIIYDQYVRTQGPLRFYKNPKLPFDPFELQSQWRVDRGKNANQIVEKRSFFNRAYEALKTGFLSLFMRK